MKTRSIFTWVAICAMILVSTQALAIDREFSRLEYGKFKFGNFKLMPGLSLQSQFDDNIYLGSGRNVGTKPEEKIVADWITHVKPLIGVDYNIADRGKIQLAYQGDLAYYKDESRNDWQNHQGLLGINYKAPSGWIFDLANDYGRKEDPYGNDTEFGLGTKSKRWTNDLKTDLGYQFGQTLRAMGYYNYFIQRYDEDAARKQNYTQDYTEHEGGVGMESKVMPKTWGYARYYYADRNFDSPSQYRTDPIIGTKDNQDADFTRNRINFGLAWDPGGKIGGQIDLGYAWYNFKNTTDTQGQAYQDQATWMALTDISYQMTEATEFGFALNRRVNPVGAQTREYFTETQIAFDITQGFMEKRFEGYGGIEYALQEYNTNSREDKNITLNAGIDWFIQKWLSAGFEYRHQQKDSSSTSFAVDNFGQYNEFSDNRYTFKITAVY